MSDHIEYIEKIYRVWELASAVGNRNKVVRRYSLTEKEYVQIEFLFKKLGIAKKHEKFLKFLKELSQARVSSTMADIFKLAAQVDVVRKIPVYEYEEEENV